MARGTLTVPAGVPHVAVNASNTEEAEAILSRTDPNEQESVVLLPKLEERVAGRIAADGRGYWSHRFGAGWRRLRPCPNESWRSPPIGSTPHKVHRGASGNANRHSDDNRAPEGLVVH